MGEENPRIQNSIPRGPSLSLYSPAKMEMMPHSGIIVSKSDKKYILGKYDKLKFSNGKVVYHNIPPNLVQQKLDVEIGFVLEDEEKKIAEELRPKKGISVTIDKNLIKSTPHKKTSRKFNFLVSI